MAACAVVGLPFVLLAALVPGPLVLPLFGMLTLALAGACAAWAWRTADMRTAPRLTWWDAAGALALIGFSAVLLSKPENVLPLLGHY